MLELADRHDLAKYEALRDLGLLWAQICEWLDDRSQHDGQRLSAAKWAQEHAPHGKKWMDEHKTFARDEWDAFLDAWHRARSAAYSPNRRPSLSTARDLIEAKKRAEFYGFVSGSSRTPIPDEPEPERIEPTTDGDRQPPAVSEKVAVNSTTDILRGDAADMMREHVPDASMRCMV